MSGRYALIIGNSQYTDKTLQQLITPAQDVKALGQILETPTIGNFDIRVMSDAASEKLRREIEQLFIGKKSTDVLLFYFSGHGVIDDYSGQLYLAVKDSKKDKLGSTAIPTRFIYENAVKSSARGKIIILDCCYSGAITTVVLAKSSPKVTVAKEFEGKGIVFLSSSTAWQYAFQETDVKKLSENTLSLFTRFLVQGLKTGEADINGDDEITVNELYQYIFSRVRKATPNQTPEISAFQQQGDIVIAKSVKTKPDIIREKAEVIESLAVEKQNEYQFFVEKTYQLGYNYFQAGNWPDAIMLFTEMLQRLSNYRDAKGLLEEAGRQLQLEILYEQGQDARERKDWKTARSLFQQIRDIQKDYRDTNNLYNEAHNEIELPRLYDLAESEFENRNWAKVVETLNTIRNLDPDFRKMQISLLLEQAKEKEALDRDYRWAMTQYEHAERTGQESDWRKVVSLLQEIERKDPRYPTATFRLRLTEAQGRLRFLEFYRQGREYFDRKRWRKAAKYLKQASDLWSQDSYLASKCPDLQTKLNEAKARQRALIPTLLKRLVAPGVILAILAAIFQNRIAAIGDYVVERFVQNEVLSTPVELTTTPTAASTVPPISTTLTRIPAPSSISYPAPVLVSPDEGTSFPARQDVKLEWKWERDLAEDEFFQVRIRPEGGQEFNKMNRTKASYQFVPVSRLTHAGTYEWQVAIVSRSGEERVVSQVWLFVVQ